MIEWRKIMQKKILFSILLFSQFFIFSETVEIKMKKTRLVSNPDFLSSTILFLKHGDRLDVIEKNNNGLYVKTVKNVKGFIHFTSVKKSKVSLSGLVPGSKKASSKEIALAAKGFSEGNEKKIKGNRKAYNFNDLNWLMKKSVSIARLKTFIKKGSLK